MDSCWEVLLRDGEELLSDGNISLESKNLTAQEKKKKSPLLKKLTLPKKKRLLGIGKSIFSPGLLKPYKCLDILLMISRLDSKLRKEKTLLSC